MAAESPANPFPAHLLAVLPSLIGGSHGRIVAVNGGSKGRKRMKLSLVYVERNGEDILCLNRQHFP